ncbi:hypothetical protein GGI35DRAFT_492688 [Trichoderma velutinum]
MAPLLAPYNNAMRLGQGFNSYTQQICLNDAVMQYSKVKNQDAVTKPPEIAKPLSIQPSQDGDSLQTQRQSTDASGKGVSQIVSYSSRFVDKLSDVTDAMNISASLSIKTATIGGAASGSFIDSDKFKESDMNFFIQVKVVNQVIFGEDYTEFQDVLPPGAKFTEVYGDTFISGFEEGGELNALISVKVSDKSKTFAIKAELEASLGTPALSGDFKGGVDMNKSEMKSSTETTVTVNWSGGGQIKPTNAIWDVNTLTLAACNFPDLVAKTPQRTYAILSKYASLKSFVKTYKPSSVLTYENAGVYTGALLDMYMDYKSIWKQIQVANFELKNRRADITIAEPSEEVRELAIERENALAAIAEREKALAAKAKLLEGIPADMSVTKQPVPEQNVPGSVPQEESKQSEEPQATTNSPATDMQVSTPSTATPPQQDVPPPIPKIADLIDFNPYKPTAMGLDKARRDCRNEMVKIVAEVDLITTFPHLALDSRREENFVSPRVFTQLLPIVTLRAVETDKPDSNLNPKNLVILGETSERPRLQQWLYNRAGRKDAPQPYPAMLSSLERNMTKSKTFDMGDDWCGVADPGKTTHFFNCLDRIDQSWEPKSVGIWVQNEILIGLKVFYTNGLDVSHGECSGAPSGTINIADDESQFAIQLALESADQPNTTARVRSLQLTLDTVKTREYPEMSRPVATHNNLKTVILSPPTNGLWSFRGFWGSVASYHGGFLALGAVWGADPSDKGGRAGQQPPAGSTAPMGPNYLMFTGRPLPEEAVKSAEEYRNKAGNYSMSMFIGDANIDKNSKYFNDLQYVQDGWEVGSITFYTDREGTNLTGYIIRYRNDNSITIRRGNIPEGELGDAVDSNAQYWTQVNFDLSQHSRDESKTAVSFVQLIDVAGTKKKFGRGLERVDQTNLCRPDPSWFLTGFWGYYNGDLGAFTQLGALWAKRK